MVANFRLNTYLCRVFLRIKHTIVSWCNGSTTGFGSVCLGSNPGETTQKIANYFIYK